MMRANVNVQGGLRQILQQQQPPQFQQQVMSGGTMMSNMQPNPQQVRASFSSKIHHRTSMARKTPKFAFF